ncbi:hypothetical protein NSR00_17950 [Aeribacillus sp. FSL K6-8394]|uniref:hypothetical protein n=1 Tax=Aeribacillus sp. FSL K6-8394 TaxID=2954570 RepID=UPI0030FA91A9
MFEMKKKNTDTFKSAAKKLIAQELQAQKRFDEIHNDIIDHKKLMDKRRQSFKFIRNK